MVASPVVGSGAERRGDPPRVVIASPALDAAGRALARPEALLDRYHALTGWAGALAQAGAEVTVVQRFGRDGACEVGGARYRFVADGLADLGGGWFRGTRLADVIAGERPDLIHVQGMVFPVFTGELRRRLGSQVTILVQDHGGIHAGSPGFRRPTWTGFHRMGLRHADGFLFTAGALAAPWQEAGIIGARQAVYEVPESSTDLGPDSVAPAGAERLPGRPALLWVGRLDRNKDPLTILAGFERALPAIPEAGLTFVYGEDDLLPELQARIAASPPLGGRVHLRGPIERRAIGRVYAGAELFVLGSHHEAASFALLEALAFGLIPVVSDIPPFRALTGGGRIGRRFPPGDPAGLADALRAATRGDLLAERRRVREHFERELSWAAVGQKALGIYRAAISRRAR